MRMEVIYSKKVMVLYSKSRSQVLPLLVILAVIMVFSSCENANRKRQLTGAGASFPAPIYRAWAISYSATSKTSITYLSVGSSRGIELVKQKKVDFGASDIPLTEEELATAGLFQIPMLIGNVVPVVNLPGIKPGSLILSGPLLAAIYLGEITSWSDSTIKRLNPELHLPDRKIIVIHRNDGSGTSYLFTGFLNQYAFRWCRQIGQQARPSWPVGQGAEYNAGVVQAVMNNSGSIGYVEFNYAKAAELDCVSLALPDGPVIKPSPEAFHIGARRLISEKTMEITESRHSAFGIGWPITGITYILLPKKAKDQEQALALLRFFTWCYDEGRVQALQFDYLPLNRTLAETSINTLHRYLTIPEN